MSWDRTKSNLETLAVQVLRASDEALNLNEIVEKIQCLDPQAFTGKSPKKSLYSVIYRREKRRTLNNIPPLLIQKKVGRNTVYTLNETDDSCIGNQIDK